MARENDVDVHEMGNKAWVKHAKANAEKWAKTDRKANGAAWRPRFEAIHLPDIRYEPGARNWLIDQLLPAEGLSVLFGRWKSLKSFVALDLAMAVARGDPWAGRIVQQGAAIYIASEGALGMRKRIAAYQARNPGDQSPFYFIAARPNLGSRPGDCEELLSAIRAAVGNKVKIKLIVLDTLVRSIGSEDENNEGMRAFVDNAEDLAAELQGAVLAIHHENAAGDRRTRGSTSLPGAAVTLWRAQKKRDANERYCHVTVEDAKDTADGMALIVRFDSHEFGEPAPGCQREDTLIVRSVEIDSAGDVTDEAKAKSAPRIPRNQAAFMTAFDQALEKHGKRRQPFRDGSSVNCVTRDQLRERYFKVRADASADTKERDFRRQLGNAVKREDLVSRERDGETLLWRAKK